MFMHSTCSWQKNRTLRILEAPLCALVMIRAESKRLHAYIVVCVRFTSTANILTKNLMSSSIKAYSCVESRMCRTEPSTSAWAAPCGVEWNVYVEFNKAKVTLKAPDDAWSRKCNSNKMNLQPLMGKSMVIGWDGKRESDARFEVHVRTKIKRNGYDIVRYFWNVSICMYLKRFFYVPTDFTSRKLDCEDRVTLRPGCEIASGRCKCWKNVKRCRNATHHWSYRNIDVRTLIANMSQSKSMCFYLSFIFDLNRTAG